MGKIISLEMMDDKLYFIVDGNLLTAKYGIEAEENRLLKKVIDYKNGVLFIFGIGTGSYLKKLLEIVDQFEKIFIFEPNEEIYQMFEKSEAYIDNEFIIYSKGNVNEFKTNLRKSNTNFRRLKVCYYGNYNVIFEDEYLECLKILKELSLLQYKNELTIKHFGVKFTENILLNMFDGDFNVIVNDFKNILDKTPALIVSAGPSLDKNYDLISKFKGVVFSGGRTFKTLKDDKIRNLIFLSVDPGENAYTLVKEGLETDTNIPFFTFFEANHNIVKNYSGPKVIMQSPHLDVYDTGVFGMPIDRMETGGSVANSAVSLAEYLGCDPIVFIGQDLAYTNDLHHSKKTFSSFDKDFNPKKYSETEGYYGGKVYTSETFKTFLNWFVNKIEISDRTYFNCTEGGAKILGATQVSFEEYLMNQTDIGECNYQKLMSIFQKEEIISVITNKMEILESVHAINKLLDKILLISLDLKNKSLSQRKIDKALEQLDKYDDEIMRHSLLNSLLNFTITNIINDFRSRKFSEVGNVADNNYNFYERFKKEMKYIEEMLGDRCD